MKIASVLVCATLVLSAGLDAVLLNLHGRAGRWFHFGGHWEPRPVRHLLAVERRSAARAAMVGQQRNIA